MFQRANIRLKLREAFKEKLARSDESIIEQDVRMENEREENSYSPLATKFNRLVVSGERQLARCLASTITSCKTKSTTNQITTSKPQILVPKKVNSWERLELKDIFKKVILTIATLKFNFTSTSSNPTATAASSGGSASFHSILSVLFKSLLIGCYYVIAFSSLILIILYINNHVSSSNAANNSAELTTIAGHNNSKLLLSHDDQQRRRQQQLLLLQQQQQHKQLAIRLKKTTSTTQRKEKLSRFVRSVSYPTSVGFDLNKNLAPLSIKISPRVPAINTRRPSNTKVKFINGQQQESRLIQRPKEKFSRPNKPHANDLTLELTERGATYSPNNRGAMAANNSNNTSDILISASSSMLSDGGQWIPIVNRIRSANSPVRPPQNNHNMNQHNKPRYTSPPIIVRKPPQLSVAPTNIEVFEGSYLPYEEPAMRHHQYHQRPRSPPIRHWRRPKLQSPLEGSRGSKMYKRVLLCDKTLVSLDYIRNLGAEPRPMHYFDDVDFDNLDNENVLNLESRFKPTIISNRVSVNISSSVDSMDDNELIEEATSSSEHNIERRYSFLTDEDPLVKCDMWDLEKGLKNRKPPPEILAMAVRADFDTVRDAINRCRQLSEKTHPHDDDQFRDGIEIMSTEDLVSLFSIKRGLIPGTKWCGLGDQANSYNDLGPKHRIDICCRAHDHCPIRLKPFRNDYGVLNIALYTKSHCDCDADFYRCLREVHSRTADMLGNLYFNVMKLQCMKEERLKVCREMKPIALGFERCVKYEDSPVKRVFRFTTPPVAY